jgi:hypothetical protein
MTAPTARHRGRWRLPAWGLAAVAVYLTIAVVSVTSGLLAGRPLYDGIPLVPYRWVNPPEYRIKDNQKPASHEVTLKFTPSGQPDPGSATSADAQVAIIFSRHLDASEYRSGGDNSFRVKITPLDPAKVGPRPQGRFFDGNAYQIEAFYPSGAPVTTGTFDIVVSYAVHATDIRRWNGSEWTPLEAPSAQREQYQIYSPSPALGIFVPTGDGDVPTEPAKASRADLVFIVLGLGATIGVAIAIVSGRKKGPPVPVGQAPGAKAKPTRK